MSSLEPVPMSVRISVEHRSWQHEEIAVVPSSFAPARRALGRRLGGEMRMGKTMRNRRGELRL
jgi:hypothetical protein